MTIVSLIFDVFAPYLVWISFRLYTPEASEEDIDLKTKCWACAFVGSAGSAGEVCSVRTTTKKQNTIVRSAKEAFHHIYVHIHTHLWRTYKRANKHPRIAHHTQGNPPEGVVRALA